MYPIDSLGPGNRLVMWVTGCSKQCERCVSPELWNINGGAFISVDKLVRMIRQYFLKCSIDGITISGGDPLEQPLETLQLCEALRELSDDILVYTGYTLNEVESKFSAEYVERLKNVVSVLIDGRYIDSLNDNKCVLRGSLNQKIYYFDSSVEEKYEKYLSEPRKVNNVYIDTELLTIGISNKEV